MQLLSRHLSVAVTYGGTETATQSNGPFAPSLNFAANSSPRIFGVNFYYLINESNLPPAPPQAKPTPTPAPAAAPTPLWWRFNGQPVGNGWTSPSNNAAFGTDHYHRAGAVKADPYDNKRNETMYFYTDTDTQLRQLVGKSSYTISFSKGELPTVKGFWSLTMYDPAALLLPESIEALCAGHQKQDIEGQLGRLAYYLLARSGRPRRRLETTGNYSR
ncbi:MAG: DUF1214 domain-containing protein [Candidatus Cybelea sp.]